VKRCVTFAFPSELIANPVIHNLGMQFRIITNILRANITEDMGWMMVQLEGEAEDIEQGIAWVTGRGVKVEPVDDSGEC
jgi:ABC-type methionine transport system ATPase subunit